MTNWLPKPKNLVWVTESVTSCFTVVYDACVLYPAPLRDLLMNLALTDLFRARWSNMIHDEWIRNVLADRPDLSRKQLERTRMLMNRHIRDCLAEGFEHLIPAIQLPDPDDRHVVAAALHSGANLIVTFNLSDFPAENLEIYNLSAQHPDNFIVGLFGLHREKVLEAVAAHRHSLKNPAKSVEDYLSTMTAHGLIKTVGILQHECSYF